MIGLQKMYNSRKALIFGTVGMLIAFMSWSSLAPLISNFGQLSNLTATNQKVLVAVPVLFGSVLRIPFGLLTDKYGGKKLFILSFLFSLIPLMLIYFFMTFHKLSTLNLFVIGLLLGISGAIFAVSNAYVSKFYPENKQGIILGIVGMGTVGNAIGAAILPWIAHQFNGILSSYLFLLILTILFLVTFIIWSDESPKIEKIELKSQLKTLKNSKLWSLALSCMLISGSFVAFGSMLPIIFGIKSSFGLNAVMAGLLSSLFSILTIVFRPIGGYLADRKNPIFLIYSSVVSISILLFLMSFFTKNFVILVIGFVLFGTLIGFANGYIFKLTANISKVNIGISTGFVGAVGSFGGFVFPIVFALLGKLQLGFLFLSLFSLCCILMMLLGFRKRTR